MIRLAPKPMRGRSALRATGAGVLVLTLASCAALDPGVTWFGWRVPTALEIAIVLLLGLAMLGIAIWEFSASD